MRMSRDRAWLLKRAEQEDKHFISVGGLVSRITAGTPAGERSKLVRAAFLRLLQLARRDKRLTTEQFAEKADIDVAELILIDNNPDYMPTPRTIHKLSSLLKVPSKTLMALAGMVELKDAQFEEEALRFAARSATMEKLTSDEQKTLQDYIKFLSEREK
jgi:HTH-type transcriptional regulator, competence development regulator